MLHADVNENISTTCARKSRCVDDLLSGTVTGVIDDNVHEMSTLLRHGRLSQHFLSSEYVGLM